MPFKIFNHTDAIPAWHEPFETQQKAQQWIDDFRKAFKFQGYYLTSDRERIPVEDVELEIIEIDQEGNAIYRVPKERKFFCVWGASYGNRMKFVDGSFFTAEQGYDNDKIQDLCIMPEGSYFEIERDHRIMRLPDAVHEWNRYHQMKTLYTHFNELLNDALTDQQTGEQDGLYEEPNEWLNSVNEFSDFLDKDKFPS